MADTVLNRALNPATKLSAALTEPSRYRWVVLTLIFFGYVVCMADRSNIGAVLPFIQDEFEVSNFAMGAVSSFFFLGYALTQIPAGLAIGKFGTRGIVSVSILLFSIVTFAMGYATTAVALIVLRLLLGLTEGATPVGMTSTINSWFPTKEKGLATGVYIASTQIAPIFVPILAVVIATNFGWQAVFHWFAIPGFVIAILFYLIVRSRPEQSKHVNEAELAHIRGDEGAESSPAREYGTMGWLDRFIRVRDEAPLLSNRAVLRSWNIWGVMLGYFFMNNVLYGMITWFPKYLKDGRGFDVMTMGLVAACPFIGGFIGAILGGYISDRVFRGRRKPLMLVTAFMTPIMMAFVLLVPNNTGLIVLTLVLTGFFLNIGWSAFTSYAMNLTSTKTYPFAISIINSGGNLGGFVAPMAVGALLDATGNYTIAFSYFIVVLVIGFALIMTVREVRPRAKSELEELATA